MSSRSSKANYGFPYPPYDEQIKLMNAIHECIVSSSVGCFESPTGTGKSLSAICAAFTWLVEEEKRILTVNEESKSNNLNENEDDDWMASMYAPKTQTERNGPNKELVTKFKTIMDRIAQSNNPSKNIKKSSFFQRSTLHLNQMESQTREKEEVEQKTLIEDEEDEFALKFYDSEEDRLAAGVDSDSSDSEPDTVEARRRGPSQSHKQVKSISDRIGLPQIFYCSRTHSQLAQFVTELQKTDFVKVDPNTGIAPIRCVTLGSRKNLCVNSSVMKLKSESRMSEACLDMQKKASKSTAPQQPSSLGGPQKRVKLHTVSVTKCAYHNRTAERQLADRALAQVRDIEDLVSLSTADLTPACPYYASRTALSNANVVCLPYNMLLSRDMREALGIDLTDKVIIVDEAHNLIETINELYSAEINVTQIDIATTAITEYLRRYQTQLNGRNLYYVNILAAVLLKLRKKLCPKNKRSSIDSSLSTATIPMEKPPHPPTVFSVNDFIFHSNLENVNLYKLKRHMEDTKLVQKIGGYAESLRQKDNNITGTVKIHSRRDSDKSGEVISALRCALQLLICLTNTDQDGRVFLLNMHYTTANTSMNTTISIPSIRFVLLNPSVPFAPILQQSRSVLLLGGTMQPFDYFTTLLLPTVSKTQLSLFTCNHVVPATQVGALIVPAVALSTPSNLIQLEFTYEKRLQAGMTNALFQALVEICENTPGGVVVFCTSFQYLEALLQRWRSTNMLSKLDTIKRVFAESRANSSDTGTGEGTSERVWTDYQRQVQSNPQEGAVLFSVINGKLSEGINFSDDLARCVVVVGLPYPDVRDPILQEKMRYVGSRECETVAAARNTDGSMVSGATVTSTTPKTTVTTAAGRRLCESMCMKAVNQSIGRAIRHIHDFACVVLLDRRYQQEHLRAQLPAWLLRNISIASSCGTSADSSSSNRELGKQLKTFFSVQQFK